MMISLCLSKNTTNLVSRIETFPKLRRILFICFSAYSTIFYYSSYTQSRLPNGFIRLSEVINDAQIDLRYYTKDNFLGRPVAGYLSPICILSIPAAQALNKVQLDLKKNGLKLKIFDAYRPQMAVDDFVHWAKDLSDTSMKKIYYPKLSKSMLFKQGYIASKSSHSRGSTIDLTLIDSTGKELDMGTTWDFFSPKSWSSSKVISKRAQQNRTLLKNIMQRYGFAPYENEWWHFTLKNEPFPETYFDFPIQ